MKLQTVRGNSIHAAMAEARRLFGDEIVLVQTTPPDGDRPAEIIVSAEEVHTPRTTVDDLRGRVAAEAGRVGLTGRSHEGESGRLQGTGFNRGQAPGGRVNRTSTDDLIGLAGAAAGYGRASSWYSPDAASARDNSNEAGGGVAPPFRTERQGKSAGAITNNADAGSRRNSAPTAYGAPSSSAADTYEASAARSYGGFAPIAGTDYGASEADWPNPSPTGIQRIVRYVADFWRRLGGAISASLHRIRRRGIRRVEGATHTPGNGLIALQPGAAVDLSAASMPDRNARYLEAIDRRIGAIETSLGATLIGYDARWRRHPAFTDMVESGISPETAGSMLATLAARGIPSDADDLAVRRDLADELRRRMKIVVARRPRGKHLFVGPSGSGKTAMIAGLALEANLGRVLVIVAQPSDVVSTQLVDPAHVYDRLGVESVSIHSARQLEFEANRLSAYDTVLVDAPSAPMHDLVDSTQRLTELLAPINGVTTHLVVDVRRDLDAVAHLLEADGDTLDALALTHLDELDRPGRLSDFFTRSRRPIYFASDEPGLKAGTCIFSPARLASDALFVGQWYTDGELTEYFNKKRSARSINSTFRPDSTALGEPMQLIGRV